MCICVIVAPEWVNTTHLPLTSVFTHTYIFIAIKIIYQHQAENENFQNKIL